MMVVASLGYLSDAYGNILYPNYDETFGWIVGVTAIIGELPFFLWLAIKGVNVQKWHERASASLPKYSPQKVDHAEDGYAEVRR